jgi:hypothetical protein
MPVVRMVGMTTDDGGVRPASTPPPAPAGYPGYAAPGYPQAWPRYEPPPGYGPTPGYPPYPGYPPAGPPPALKPGIIPLRPLGLSDILNAAFAYIRVNPKATLGLTTAVVIVSQIIVVMLTALAPLTFYGQAGPWQMEAQSASDVVGMFLPTMAAGLISALSGVVLSGMLTVVVGRAVFGAHITVKEAWVRMRGRLLALLGLVLLEGLGIGLLIFAAVVIIAVTFHLNAALGVLVVIVVVFGGAAALVYLWTMLSFAPVLIVLERLPVFAAVGRSFALVRGSFWRVLGIRVLALLVASVVSFAVSVPFSLPGELLGVRADSAGAALAAAVLVAVGGAIGQIITAPFTAGIVVLLYMDRRIRAEAFDLVLQTGAVTATAESVGATDDLWLIRHP